MPGGSCNYRDLSNGAKAPVCGCTRFWLNTHFNGHDPSTERVWCFCGHHACFHEAFSREQSRVGEPASYNNTVRTVPAGDAHGYDGNAQVHGEMGYNRSEQPRRQISASVHLSGSQSRPTGLGIQSESQQPAQSINTRVWEALNAFARDQDDGRMSITTSKLPSTATQSLAGDLRASPTRILQERMQQSRSMGPPVTIPALFPPGSITEEYSATEVATPSIAGTPDFTAFARQGTQTRSSPSNIRPAQLISNVPRDSQIRQTTELAPLPEPTVLENRQLAPVPETYVPLQEVQNILRAYGQRIDVLENLSFSHVPADEFHEKLELFDGRLLDVEQWRGDHEESHVSEAAEAATEQRHRRLLPIETSSFGSDGSYDHNAAMYTDAAVLATLAANAETGPRFDALESRILDLEYASLPSHNRPWHVQVVLLPWGPGLNGVWFSSAEATQHSLKTNTQASEEWSGAQSAPKVSFSSSSSGAWTTESIQAWADEAQDWLSPKACGPSGTVFQRLASRGLVQEVSLTASDSRHVLNIITKAFGRILHRDDDKPNPPEANQYQGLRESFIPLRKIRKSSRLRFLGTAEMATSATWSARWFDSSVFMKVNDGQRRLYITSPEAYLQSVGPVWTWQKIRKLPLHDASEEEDSAKLSGVAIEACWSYNDRLDQSLSSHASFDSHESQWSIRSQDSDLESVRADPQPTLARYELRSHHQRTVSMPSVSSAAEQVTAIMPKRRVASFETPAPPGHAEVLATAKRRRMDASPEAERRGVGLTPRWSREPPSPFTASENVGDARSQGASSGRKRGATPFAYATPHSNATFVGHVANIGADGDTEADTEMGVAQAAVSEDEWNGADEDVDAALQFSDSDSDGQSSADEQEFDGTLTSYESRNPGARSSDSIS